MLHKLFKLHHYGVYQTTAAQIQKNVDMVVVFNDFMKLVHTFSVNHKRAMHTLYLS